MGPVNMLLAPLLNKTRIERDFAEKEVRRLWPIHVTNKIEETHG